MPVIEPHCESFLVQDREKSGPSYDVSGCANNMCTSGNGNNRKYYAARYLALVRGTTFSVDLFI